MPPRTSPRKKATATAPAQDKASEKATNGAAVPKPTKPKTRAKAAPAAAATTKKRKAVAAAKDDETTDAEQDHECDSHGEEEEEEEAKKPAPKKRKTTAGKKGNKDEASMAPLAERTAVSALKKAMYIGAHVSAAGGMSHHPIISAFLKLTPPPPSTRCPKRHHQHRPHRWQLARPLPQIPAKMGLPAPRPDRPRRLPRSRQRPRLRSGPARPPARVLPRQPRPGRRRQGRPGLRQLLRRPAAV